MVKTACVDDALFSWTFFELEASLVEDQLQENDIGKRKKIKETKKRKDIGHFLVQILISVHAQAKTS